jgi:hypothetical protein
VGYQNLLVQKKGGVEEAVSGTGQGTVSYTVNLWTDKGLEERALIFSPVGV